MRIHQTCLPITRPDDPPQRHHIAIVFVEKAIRIGTPVVECQRADRPEGVQRQDTITSVVTFEETVVPAGFLAAHSEQSSAYGELEKPHVQADVIARVGAVESSVVRCSPAVTGPAITGQAQAGMQLDPSFFITEVGGHAQVLRKSVVVVIAVPPRFEGVRLDSKCRGPVIHTKIHFQGVSRGCKTSRGHGCRRYSDGHDVPRRMASMTRALARHLVLGSTVDLRNMMHGSIPLFCFCFVADALVIHLIFHG